MSNILKYRKSELQDGDIILFRSPMVMPVGYLIQCAIRTRYSHLAIYIGNNKVIEAIPFKGVVITDLSIYADNTKVCVMRLKEYYNPIFLITWLYTQLNKGYDYIAFLRMALFMMLQKWGIIPAKWRNSPPKIENADRYHCFQLGAHAFKQYLLFEVALDNCYDDDFIFSPKLKKVMED